MKFAPIYVRKRLYPLLAAMAASIAIAAVLDQAAFYYGLEYFELASSVVSLVPFVALIGCTVWSYRLHCRVAKAGGRLCPSCAYDLQGSLPENGNCPECGEPYTRRSLDDAWYWFTRRPLYVERIAHFGMVAGACIFLTVAATASARRVSLASVQQETWNLVNIFILGAALVVVTYTIWKLRRVRTYVRITGRRLCPWCGRNLYHAPERGACPDCGSHYTRQSLEMSWRCFPGGALF